jgi:hypothetical protein
VCSKNQESIVLTSVNAIELSGGVSADTKQSDYLSTAYLKATHNAFDLE